jgi:hypothetical protein
MLEQDEVRQAAEALAAVRTHQDRARRAARLPWWFYAGMFVLVAGSGAVNDFASLSGAKLIALLVLIATVATFGYTMLSGARGRTEAPLDRVRGVQPRRRFVPWVFIVVLVIGGAAGTLISHYGAQIAHGFAGAVGLSKYPNTAAGLLLAAGAVAFLALGQTLLAIAQRSADDR